jgi:hypothetical protein
MVTEILIFPFILKVNTLNYDCAFVRQVYYLYSGYKKN